MLAREIRYMFFDTGCQKSLLPAGQEVPPGHKQGNRFISGN